MTSDYNQEMDCRTCRHVWVPTVFMVLCVGRKGAVMLWVSLDRLAHSKRWSLVKAHLRPSVCHGLPSPMGGTDDWAVFATSGTACCFL